jgi:hypothetical protein
MVSPSEIRVAAPAPQDAEAEAALGDPRNHDDRKGLLRPASDLPTALAQRVQDIAERSDDIAPPAQAGERRRREQPTVRESRQRYLFD